MIKEKAVFCWSGGKDSALVLHRIQTEGRLDIVALLTTSDRNGLITMHGVSEDLIRAQAEQIGLPLQMIETGDGDFDAYEAAMTKALSDFREQGVTKVVYGDIHLADLRSYKENFLRPLSIYAEFPLWNEPSAKIAEEFIGSGFRSLVCCIDSEKMNDAMLGKDFDQDFLDLLPVNVDPCGENGEFHTFCYDGPIFNKPLNLSVGAVSQASRFHLCRIELQDQS